MVEIRVLTFLATPEFNLHSFYTLKDAAVVLGYGHPNTIRNKHLEPKGELARHYVNGNLRLDRAAVDALATRLNEERQRRPSNWRILNLGPYAGPLRPRRRRTKLMIAD